MSSRIRQGKNGRTKSKTAGHFLHASFKSRAAAAAGVLLLACLLTGCTKTSGISLKDGSITIKYSSAMIFQRTPVFTETDGVLHMKFNGYEWYIAQIISNTEAETLTENREILAESSNMRVYDTSDDSEDEYQFTYLFDLTEDEDHCIRFDTDQAPTIHGGYGNDFTMCIRYFVNGTEVVPEVPASDADFYAAKEDTDSMNCRRTMRTSIPLRSKPERQRN